MKNIVVVFIFLFVTFCSLTLEAPSELMVSSNVIPTYNDIDRKSLQYPYFNIRFLGFLVFDVDSNSANPTPEENRQARIITDSSKRRMLGYLDLIRFTLNTPEFLSNFMDPSVKLQSARDASGPNGSIKVGDYYDKTRVLYILQTLNLGVAIRKIQMSSGAAAVGVVGHSLYVQADDSPSKSADYWIAFPNREDWDTGGYFNIPYMSGNILHEILHNAGFTHHGAIDYDPVYSIEGVYKRVVSDLKWQEKYKTQLAELIPFYPVKYKEWVGFDTTPFNTPKNILLRSVLPIVTPDEEIIVCDHKEKI